MYGQKQSEEERSLIPNAANIMVSIIALWDLLDLIHFGAGNTLPFLGRKIHHIPKPVTHVQKAVILVERQTSDI